MRGTKVLGRAFKNLHSTLVTWTLPTTACVMLAVLHHSECKCMHFTMRPPYLKVYTTGSKRHCSHSCSQSDLLSVTPPLPFLLDLPVERVREREKEGKAI